MQQLFTGQKVRLRATEPEDWEIFYADEADSEAMRLGARLLAPRSKAEFRKWFTDRLAQQASQPDRLILVVETLDGQVAGGIASFWADRKNGTFAYGLALFRPFWGGGYGAEAVVLLLRYFFRELGYQKVNAHVYGFNLRSQAFHRKLGFVEEARLRRVHFTDGAYHDDVIFGMTAEEFFQRYGR